MQKLLFSLLVLLAVNASVIAQQLNPITLTIDEPQIGDSIGRLQITNPAPNTTYIYKLVDDSTVNATFEIDTLTGVFWVKNNAWVDADKFSQVNFSGTAKVLGTGINSFSAGITINLNNVVEPVYAGFGNTLENTAEHLVFAYPTFQKTFSISTWSKSYYFQLGGIEFRTRPSGLDFPYDAVRDNRLLPNGRYNHLFFNIKIGTIGNDTMEVYFNGSFIYSGEVNIANYPNGNNSLYQWGHFDETAIWSRVLTQEEIKNLYLGKNISIEDTSLTFYFNADYKTPVFKAVELSSNRVTGNKNLKNSEIAPSFTPEYTVKSEAKTTDTLFYLKGYHPRNLPITYQWLNTSNNFLGINQSTGAVYPIADDTLSLYQDTSLSLDFSVEEPISGSKDSASITLKILSRFRINDTSVVMSDNSLFGYSPCQISIQNKVPFYSYSYSIDSGNVNNTFNIDSNGFLFVSSPSQLDATTTPNYSLRVIVTETPSGLTDTFNVYLTVNQATSQVYAGFGNSLKFKGEDGNQKVSFPDLPANYYGNSRTLSMWYTSTSSGQFILQLDGGNIGRRNSNVGSYNENEFNDLGSKPNLVTLVDDGTIIKYYINGKYKGLRTYWQQFARGEKNENYLFYYNNDINSDSSYFHEIAVWNRALSETEVKALYLNGIQPEDTSLIRYYPFNQSKNNISVIDYSGNNLHGSLNTDNPIPSYTNFIDTVEYILSKDEYTTKLQLRAWEPKYDSISYSLIGPGKSNFKLVNDGIYLDSLNTFPNSASTAIVGYKATDLSEGGQDSSFFKIAILPVSEGIDTTITIPEDTFIGSILLEDVIINKNPSHIYTYEIIKETQIDVFEIGDTSGRIYYTNRDNVFQQKVPSNQLEIKITSSSGKIDTAKVTINFNDHPNIIFSDFGNAYVYGDKSSDGFTLKKDELNIDGKNFTIEFWFKNNNVGQTKRIFKRDCCNELIINANSEVTFGGQIISDPLDSNWHHIALVFSYKTGEMIPYIDGVSSGYIQTFYNFYNYHLPSGFDFYGNFNTGSLIDELRIWSGTRSTEKIASSYKKQLNPNEDSLMAYFDFNQINGDHFINNLTSNPILGYPFIDTISQQFIKSTLVVFDTLLQSTPSLDTVSFAIATSLYNNSNFSYTKLPGNTDFQYFDLDSTTGLISVSPYADFSGVNGLLTLNYLATDLTEPTAFDTGTVYVYVKADSTQYADSRFDVSELASNGDSIGRRVVTNPDSTTTYSYSIIGGNNDNIFRVDSTSGVFYVANADSLTYDKYQQLTLTAVANGNSPSTFTDTATITINVLPLVNPPPFAGFGNALEFDGTQSSTPIDNQYFIDKSFSVSVWAKRSSFKGTNYFLGGSFSLHIGFNGNRLWFDFWGDQLSPIISTGLNEWHHYVFTFDKNTLERKIYEDGLLISKDLANRPVTNTNTINLGTRESSIKFEGALDELFVWDKALNSEEVLALANTKIEDTAVISGLVQAFNFEQTNPTNQLYDFVNDTTYILQFIDTTPIIQGPDTSLFSIHENFQTGNVIGQLPSFDFDSTTQLTYSLTGFSTVFSVSPSGLLTLKNGSVLDADNTPIHYINYAVTNGNSNLSDTGTAKISIFSTPSINDTVLSINQLTQNYQLVVDFQAQNINPQSQEEFKRLATNAPGLFEFNDETGMFTVANSDSLLYSKYPQIIAEIAVFDPLTKWRDTITVTINVLNSGAPVYAGLGNSLLSSEPVSFFNTPVENVFSWHRPMSVSLWVNPQNYGTLFNLYGLEVIMNANTFVIKSTHPDANFPQFLNLNEWAYLTITFEGESRVWKVYKNGQFLYDENRAHAYQNLSSDFIPSNTPFDELTVWKRPLTQTQIRDAYRGSINTADTNLLIYANNNHPNNSFALTNLADASNLGSIIPTANSAFSSSINQLYIISNNNTEFDTIAYGIGFQPNGIDFTFSNANPAQSKFSINPSTGGITVKHQDSLAAYANDTITFRYVVQESLFGGTDTAAIDFVVIPEFSIENDTLLVEEKPLLGHVIKTVDIIDPLPFESYDFEFSSATNYSFLSIDSIGKIRVEVPDSLVISNFSTLNLEVIATEQSTSKKDTANIHLILKDTTSNIYAGHGNFLRINDGEGIDFPSVNRQNWKGRTMSFWLEMTDNNFNFNLDKININLNTAYDIRAGHVIVDQNNFYPSSGPSHICIVFEETGSPLVYRDGKFIDTGRDFGTNDDTLTTSVDNLQDDYLAISDLAVWKTPLSDSAIAEVFKLGIDQNDSNLVRYYPMNQVDENGAILDYSGNNLHAKIVNRKLANWINIEDTLEALFTIVDTNYTIGYAKGWEPKNDSIGFTLIGPNASDFQINADNSITLNPNNSLPNDTSLVKLSYVATDLVGGATDTFSYNLTILPATEAYDTVISMPEDTLLGTVFFDDLLTNKNPNLTYNYEIVYATQWGVFEVGDTSGNFELVDRDDIFPQQVPLNEVKVRITNSIGFVDTAIVKVNYIDKTNQVYPGFGRAFTASSYANIRDFEFSVDFGDTLDFTDKDATVEYWTKLGQLNTGKIYYNFFRNGFYGLYFRYRNDLVEAIIDGASARIISQSTDTNWHHIAVTYNTNQNQFTYYYDGDSVNTASNLTGFNFHDGISNIHHPKDLIPNTKLDNFKIYKRRLSSEEIKRASKGEIYQNNDSLLLFLNFDQPNEVIVNNLANTSYYGVRLNNITGEGFSYLDQLGDRYFTDSYLFTDTITQAISANDTLAFAQASTFFKNSKFQYTKIPGNTDFQYFDLNDSTGLISVLPQTDFSSITGLLTLNYLATDLTEPTAFDTGTVYVFIDSASTQLANTRFIIDENPNIFDTIGFRRVLNPDSNTTYSYHIVSGNIGNSFGIDTLTSDIYVVSNDSIDHERYPTFRLIVEAKGVDTSTFVDTATITINLNDLVEPVYAGFGNGFDLGGSNDYVLVPSFPDSAISITQSVWVNTNQVVPNGVSMLPVLTKREFNQGGEGWPTIGFSNSGAIISVDDFAYIQNLVGTTKVNDGNWHLITGVKSQNTYTLYVDGELEGSLQNNRPLQSLSDYTIGAKGSYNGLVDEAVAWNKALSVSEIKALYAGEYDFSSDSIIFFYDFNSDSSFSKVNDLSINKNHGNIVNANISNFVQGAYYYAPISENAQQSDSVTLLRATDYDNNFIEFKFLSGDTSDFILDSLSGVISVSNKAHLDFETDSLYAITYSVFENGDHQTDTGLIQIRVINGPDLQVTNQGPGYAAIPQKHYNGIPVTIFNDSPNKYTNRFTLNVEVDGNQDSLSFDSINGFVDTTLFFPFPIENSLGNHNIKTYFSFSAAEPYPFSDTVETAYTITDTLLTRTEVPDTNANVILLGVSDSVSGIQLNQLIGVSFQLNQTDTLNSVEFFLENLSATDSFNIQLFELNTTIGNQLETATFSFSSAADGFKALNLNCFNELDSGKYLLAIGKINNNGNIPQLVASFENYDSTALWLFDSIWSQPSPTQLGFYSLPVIKWNFKRNQTYQNLIATYSDSANCEGNRHVFFKEPTFTDSINWNNSIGTDTLINQSTQWVFAEHVIENSGCSIVDSIYSTIQNNKLFSVTSDSIELCERVSFSIHADEFYDAFTWKLNDSVLSFSDSVYLTTHDTAGLYTYTTEASNQNNTCFQNDTLTYVIRDQLLAKFDPLPPICGNDSTINLIGFVSDTIKGFFSGAGITDLNFNPNGLAVDSSYTLVYSRLTQYGCLSTDTQSIAVGAFPIFNHAPLTNEVCDYDSLNLDSTFQISPYNGFYAGFGVSSRQFKTDSINTFGLKYFRTDTLVNGLTCTDSVSLSVKVNFTPQVSFDLGYDGVCIDTANVLLSGGVPSGAGSVYSGTGINNSGNAYYFYPQLADTGVHPITFTHTTPDGCYRTAFDTLMVNAIPRPSISPIPAFCAKGDTLHLNNFGNYGNYGTFSGNGVMVDSATFFFNPDSASISPNNIILYAVVDSFGCKNDTFRTVTVNPLPFFNFNPIGPYCVYDAADTLTQFVPNSTVSYFGPGVFLDTTTGNYYFDPDTSIALANTIFMVVENNLTGCIDTNSQQVMVDTIPFVSLNLSTIDTLCIGSSPVLMSGGVPAGGTYSIINSPNLLQSGQYLTNNALVGRDTIVYTYTNQQGCINSDTAFIDITPLPQISFNLPVNTICNSGSAFALSGGSFSSGNVAQNIYKGPGVNAGIFDPNFLSPGGYSIYYVVTDSIGCKDSVSQPITVNTQPLINFPIIPNVCLHEDSVPIQAPVVGAQSWNFSITTTSTNTLHPDSGYFTANMIGTDTIKFVITDTNSCSDSAFRTITIDSIPTVAFSLPPANCKNNNNPILLNTGVPSGGVYTFNDSLLISNVSPSVFSPGINHVVYSFTNANGCVGTDTQSVIINIPDSVWLATLPEVCSNGTPITLNQGWPTGGVYSSSLGMINDSIFDPSAVVNDSILITYTYTNTNNCDTSISSYLHLNDPIPVSFNPALPAVCINDDTLNLQANLSVPLNTFSSFAFSGPGINDSAGSFYPLLAGVGGKNIQFNYTDSNSCSNSISAQLIVRDIPNPELVQSEELICIGDSAVLSVLNFQVEVIWENGDTTTSIEVFPDTAKWYQVTITDIYGCINTDSILQDVYNNFFVGAEFDTVSTELNTPVSIYPLDNDRGNITEFSIADGPFNGTTNIFNPELEYTPNAGFRRVDSIFYEMCDDFCPSVCDTGLVKIKVFGDPSDFIPKGFSPDGDGFNDFWFIPGIELYPNNKVVVFNRWGDVVFDAAPYQNNESASFRGQPGGVLSYGNQLPDGTYFFMITLDDGLKPISGSLEIKRQTGNR